MTFVVSALDGVEFIVETLCEHMVTTLNHSKRWALTSNSNNIKRYSTNPMAHIDLRRFFTLYNHIHPFITQLVAYFRDMSAVDIH